jgi:maltose alpha-D-glucosyltransferase/alpha-amylase
MENDRARIEAINIALFSLPGSPIIYYGDEIGMGDERFNDRDGVRTPMQWNAGKNAGFSTADSDKLILPIINQPGYTKEEINVEQQESNPHSLLNWTRHILKTRFSTNVFGRGSIKFLQCRKSVLSFILAYGNEVVLVVLNLSDRQETLSLDLSHYSDKPMQEMISNQSLGKASSSAKLDLPAYGYKWVKIG